jgi:hypothetical protein
MDLAKKVHLSVKNSDQSKRGLLGRLPSPLYLASIETPMSVQPDFLCPAHDAPTASSSNENSPGCLLCRVASLYEAACKHGTTYEAVVHSSFCSAMDDAFGSDENDADVANVFTYARQEYGYLSAEENAEIDAERASNGDCHHGLNWLTCPAGCFE